MNKKLLFAIIITFFLLAGCGKVNPSNVAQPNGQSQTVTTSDSIDYDQYTKKTWVSKNGTDDDVKFSFCISKIANGEIEGEFSTDGIAVINYGGVVGKLAGKINNDTAECEFSDKEGNNGNVKLVFKANDEIEATIKYTNKSKTYKDLSLDGTFLLKPFNLNDIDVFTPFKDQSFTINLNSWGNVKFVSGRYIGKKHIFTACYLTNEAGDVLYEFNSAFPYAADVKAVSFQDVNKDGLKDIIVIVGNSDDSSSQIVTVFFQKDDGSFDYDDALDNEIYDSGNNKDIKTVTDYLSKKF
ncbi:hypothetical protein [uncultured Clostridium sp.]|uniref:hypothetical protein n=1 Tax=uncultured Clostridium sp. TaxID=59620 RepID=UPI0028E57EF4|nr:hypothetical protein [uncultured Clostridium sp.]